jgi:hypothetical protein
MHRSKEHRATSCGLNTTGSLRGSCTNEARAKETYAAAFSSPRLSDAITSSMVCTSPKIV